MSLNGITNALSPYSTVKEDAAKKKDLNTTRSNNSSSDEKAAAVYEPSNASSADQVKKSYNPDTKTIAKLKAESEKRMENLRSLVEKLILKQGQTYTETTDMFALLRKGELEIDPETAAKARADIAEDGYWGVNQTSERLFSFAIALTGGDPSKAQEMKEAFIQGFEAAQKTWGGELPEICQKTYEATIEKFDEWINQNQSK